MASKPAFVAIDLGAESGRVVLGELESGLVSLREVSRFANRTVGLPDGLHWDIVGLYREARAGIDLAVEAGAVRSVGVDSWGVDYGLLDDRGHLLGLPYHYRDRRTDGLAGRYASQMKSAGAYETTGIRPMPINTVFQLLAEERSAALGAAHRVVLIPDLLAFWLCGVTANERTAASTTGLLDARTGDWNFSLAKELRLPERIFGRLVDPGTILGALNAEQLDDPARGQEIQVVATAGHDTAAAFAGAPLQGSGVAIISSGTWSLVGVELDGPVLTERALAAELSNERGVFGTIRLLRNVMGLWLLQRCRAAWREDGSTVSYEELARLASAVTGEVPLFDPDHSSLVRPDDMPAAIEALLRESGQQVPQDRGGLARSIFTSLACKYRLVLEELERVTARSIHTVHVVGGGSSNALLCQLTADITRREVLAGPAEATALGNILLQACALGHLSGLDEMRQVSHASFPPVPYHATGSSGDAEATYRRFLEYSPRPQGRKT